MVPACTATGLLDWAMPGCRSSTSRPASSRCPTSRAHCGSYSTARSTTSWSSARSSRPSVIDSGPIATPRSSSTRSNAGERARSSNSTGSSRWPCGTPRKQTLTLARDRLGVRPLYLCEHGGRLWFASEVKAIFAGDRSIPRRLDPVGLAETFTFWTSVAPQSVFSGITELEPGHVRVISRRGVEDRPFWTAHYPVDRSTTFPGSLDEAAEQLRDALDDAVRLRILRADVTVGAYLSGGLDSSLIAALGYRVKGDRFRTFSIRFEDAEFDETEHQRTMAEFIGSDHREVTVRRQDIAEVFPDVVAHAERPLLRTAPAPLFLLSRLVRDAGIKVVLTGEGADEMFAGYDLFREGKVRRFWGRQPASTIRPRLLERLYPYLARSPVAQPDHGPRVLWSGPDELGGGGFRASDPVAVDRRRCSTCSLRPCATRSSGRT